MSSETVCVRSDSVTSDLSFSESQRLLIVILLQFILIYRVCVPTLQDWDYIVSHVEEGLRNTRTDGND